MHDLMNFKSLSKSDLEIIIDLSLRIKQTPQAFTEALQGKKLALLFQKTSTRTRCSAEMGMKMLGGHTMYLDWKNTNFTLTDLQDEAQVLGSYVDVILARFLHHTDLLTLAAGSQAPVINGLCEKYHPCQALADLMTIWEAFNSWEQVNITYLGMANNVSNSLSELCVKLGIPITLGLGGTDEKSIDVWHTEATSSSPWYFETDDVQVAVKDANVIYTDTWINLEYYQSHATAQQKATIKSMLPYQLNQHVLDLAPPHARIMHDLPAHVGYEIGDGMLHHPDSLVFQQAENRLWSIMGLLVFLFEA
ncbi:hypothetical protein AUK40_05230 [Candidatus Wirthbacteria bacterium CG2_30_54_11]|uniref:Ornithine carbamoyltransferase n=1 Tax=Candidatus Wirthbacteria bacterium CG2_30_54_11 TaxID=1817892 RepID=A0A1J5ISP1_9BACT|nr:MAG: hypothetical protein AUK40_05230 [Candidatus Wirthbacteria bacterium CG2_30_54_11]